MDGVEVTRARVRQLFEELIDDAYEDPDPDTFIETLDSAIRDYPKEDEFYESRAILARAFDDIDVVLDVYDSAVDNIGSVPVRVRRFRTRAQLAEGLETIRSDFATLKDATIEEEWLPAFLDGVSNFGLMLQTKAAREGDDLARQRLYREAINLWSYSISKSETNGEAFQRRGRCFFHLKDYPRAIEDATRHIELAPNLRQAWMSRAAARRAAGDEAGARADETAAADKYNYDVSPRERAELDASLARDKDENLERRLALFTERSNDGADEAVFQQVQMIREHRWAFCCFPDEIDLSYTLGLFYRLGHPELMIHSKEIDVVSLKAWIEPLIDEIFAGKQVAAGDRVSLGKWVGTWETPTNEDLEAFPYGYGEFFYRNFMNQSGVPLLLARISK